MLYRKYILVNHGKTQFGRVEYAIVGIALILTSAEPERKYFFKGQPQWLDVLI